MGTVRSTVWRVVAAVSAAVLVATGVAVNVPSARAESAVFYVNTDAFGKSGTCVEGVGSYTGTTADTCSLGAALTAANALGATADPSEPVIVTLAPDFAATIPEGTQRLIIPNSTTTNHMTTIDANSDLPGTITYYMITSNVTLNLQNKLGIDPGASGADGTAIYIKGKNIQLLNASNIRTGSTSISVGTDSSHILIDGGSTVQTTSYWMRQWLVIGRGVSDITISNYTIGNGRSGDDETCIAAAICLGTATTGAAISDVLIDHVKVYSTQNGTATPCSTTNASGCVTNAIVVYSSSAVEISGLTVQNSTFDNLYKAITAPTVVSFSPGVIAHKVSNFQFVDNIVTNSGANCGNLVYCSSIFMPYDSVTMQGKNIISGNTFFTDPLHPVPFAIGYNGSSASTGAATTLSNLVIVDNFFDGYTHSAIWLLETGIVTMEKNRFGENQASQKDNKIENTISEETISGIASPALVINENNYSNNMIRTWYPTIQTVNDVCATTFTVTAPTTPATAATNIPPPPVRLDVYWTETTKAEIFLGSYGNFDSSPQTLTVTLPREAIGTDGKLKGGLRLQTQSLKYWNPASNGQPESGQLESSQYSRVVALPANECTLPTPAIPGTLTIEKRAWLGVAEGRTWDEIVNKGMGTEVKSGVILPPGTQVTWTYTVLYTNKDTSLTGKPGPQDVEIRDDKLKESCEEPLDMEVNVPNGCVLRGTV